MGTPAMGPTRQEVQLTAGGHVILPTPTEKLLGCNIHENMKWGEHLQLNEQSLTRYSIAEKLLWSRPLHLQYYSSRSSSSLVTSYIQEKAKSMG